MFVFHSIKELIETLYQNRNLIGFLFSKRRIVVHYDNLLSYMDNDEDKIETLINKNILVRLGNGIELHEDILTFLEKFTDTSEEITVGYIHDLVQNIEENIALYLLENNKEKRFKYLFKVRKELNNVGKNILSNIKVMRRSIENMYVTESNYRIKKQVLENYDKKRDDIDQLIGDIQKLLKSSDWDYFSKVANDHDLQKICLNLRTDLDTARTNLISITQKIIEFLNDILQQEKIDKHIQDVKRLKDQFVLQEKSDFEHVVHNESSFFFQSRFEVTTNLSLSYLLTDDATSIIIKVAKKEQRSVLSTATKTEPIDNAYFDTREKYRYIPNLNNLKHQFLARGGDLFEFIIHYEFEQAIDVNKRVTIFCQIANLYSDELFFTDKFKWHDDIEYMIIQPKEK